VVGRLLFHVPGGGTLLLRLFSPLVFSLVAGAVVAWMLWPSARDLGSGDDTAAGTRSGPSDQL
jgi:hypothetical protein